MSRDDMETVQKKNGQSQTGVLSWYLAVWIEKYHKIHRENRCVSHNSDYFLNTSK
jgi:hypothetical protein